MACECFRVMGGKHTKREFVAKHDLYMSRGRAFARVIADGKECYMDAVTGSLYKFGKCLTSDVLTLGSLKKDHDGAVKFLMSVTTIR